MGIDSGGENEVAARVESERCTKTKDGGRRAIIRLPDRRIRRPNVIVAMECQAHCCAARAHALLQSNAFAMDVEFEFLLSKDINGGELWQ